MNGCLCCVERCQRCTNVRRVTQKFTQTALAERRVPGIHPDVLDSPLTRERPWALQCEHVLTQPTAEVSAGRWRRAATDGRHTLHDGQVGREAPPLTVFVRQKAEPEREIPLADVADVMWSP